MRRLAYLVGPWLLLAAWLVVMALWLASYGRNGAGWHVTYGPGAVWLFYLDPAGSEPYAADVYDHVQDRGGWGVCQLLLSEGAVTSDSGRLGFRYADGTMDRNRYNNSPTTPFAFRLVAVPFWPLAIATAVPPALAFWWVARRRTRVAGHRCVACGYDLRGSPDRCPECGTAAGSNKAAAPAAAG